MENVKPLREVGTRYEEHDICLLAPDWKFTVTGPLFPNEEHVNYRTYASFDLAKAEIRKRKEAKALEEKTRITLALRLLYRDGTERIIKGIHSGTGNLLPTEKVPDPAGAYYPPHPFIEKRLQELDQLNKRVDELQNILHRVQINGSRAYGRIEPDRYPKLIDELQEEHRTKAALVAQLYGSR